MALVLVFIFNWWILFLGVNCILTFIYPSTSYLTFYIILGTFLFLSTVAFLINSFLGQWVLNHVLGTRPLIAREKNKLMPVIEHVQQAIQRKMGFSPLAVHVLIMDDRMPKAFVLGDKTLIISRGLYETLSDEELKGVIAHEFGHLHAGDNSKFSLAVGLNGVSLTILWATDMLVRMMEFIAGLVEPRGGGESVLLSLPLKIIILFTQLISWFLGNVIKIGNKILHLMFLYIGRGQEFKADKFALNVGFGPGLLSFLEKTKNFDFDQPQSLFERLYTPHPKIMMRIGELENRMRARLSVD